MAGILLLPCEDPSEAEPKISGDHRQARLPGLGKMWLMRCISSFVNSFRPSSVWAFVPWVSFSLSSLSFPSSLLFILFLFITDKTGKLSVLRGMKITFLIFYSYLFLFLVVCVCMH